MHLTGFDLLFWATGLFTHIALLLVLILRGRVRKFPFFTGLIVMNVLRTLVLYGVWNNGNPSTYFYSYWSFALLDTLLQLFFVVEVTTHILRPLGTWSPDLRRSSASLCLASIAVAIALTWVAAPEVKNWRESVVMRGSMFSAALISELFVGMVALSVSVGVPWRTHAARLAQGFGGYSVLDIVIEGMISIHGVAHRRAAYTTLAHMRVEFYQLCVCFWIVMLARDAPAPREMPERMRRQLWALQARVASDLQLLRNWNGE